MDNIPNESRYGFSKCSSSYVPPSPSYTLGNIGNFDAFGRLRVSNPVTLFDSQNRYRINDKYYSNTIGTGSSVTYSLPESTVLLNVSSNSSDFTARESKYVFNYQPGKSLLIMNTFVMNHSKSNLVQRVGYFGEDNGYYVELSHSNTVSIVERSNSTGTVTNLPVVQESWNGDKLDGLGPSRISLNMQNSQIFFTDIEWLGVGAVRTGFVIDGKFITCHTFYHANILPRTYLTTACLPVRYEIYNTGITSGPSTLRQICSTVLSEGGYEPREQLFCTLGPITGTTIGGTLVPLCTIRLNSSRLDAIAIVKQIDVATGTNNDVVQWQLVLNGTLTGATYAATTDSTNVQIDTDASAISGGRVINTGFSQFGSANTPIDSSIFEAHIGRNSFTKTSDTLSLCVVAISSNPKVYWSLAWAELL